MVVLLHVLVALTSVGTSTFGFFKPSKKILFFSYVLVAATLLSGLYLVVSEPARMLHTCLAGLTYVAAISVVTGATHARLANLRSHKTTS